MSTCLSEVHFIQNDLGEMAHSIKKEMSEAMRKTLFILLGALVLGVGIAKAIPTTNTPTTTNEQLEIPSYAKWSKIAIKETQLKYPNANIIDYLHEGSEVKGNSTIEKFKLWLKDSNKEFGVFVRIKYMTETEEMVSIDFQETSR